MTLVHPLSRIFLERFVGARASSGSSFRWQRIFAMGEGLIGIDMERN